mmetsp:Transcript_3019/g.5301  ORF Transcript_3019/g.5301 Transcript_3019/m.5301 type:complete len:98 (-) Transcript_3019:1383-1676(-)
MPQFLIFASTTATPAAVCESQTAVCVVGVIRLVLAAQSVQRCTHCLELFFIQPCFGCCLLLTSQPNKNIKHLLNFPQGCVSFFVSEGSKRLMTAQPL